MLPTGNSTASVVLTVSVAPVTCVELPMLTVLELALTYNTLAAVPFTAKSTVSNAELILTRPFVSVMSSPLTTMLPPVTLVVADTTPLVNKFPPLTLPATLKSVSTPTDVKLEPVTPELINVPVNVSALALDATTPVNCEPLPMK